MKPRDICRAVIVGTAIAGWLSCARDRMLDRGEPCVSWQDDIAAVLAGRCVACHGSAAGYDLSSYAGVLGPGSDDVPNAIAGEPMSALLARLAPGTADEQHASFADLHPLIDTWVVECELSYRRSRVHAGGIMNPTDSEFHGRLLAAEGWKFDLCAECHGQDFSGGASGSACTSCHQRGPTDCTTCHGNGPTSGAHAAHTAVHDCAECHLEPEHYVDIGHILGPDGLVDPPPAEVVLGALAARGERDAPPSHDPATGRCSGVYCHGATLGDTRATDTAPTWTGNGPAACNTCHGMAPSSHTDDRCAACHPTVVDATGAIRDPALHIDGAIAIGKGTGDCTDCHGPPPDLAGNTATSAITVGVHRSHVQATHRLRGPIPCSDCHHMPATIASSGHIDSAGPAEVFPGGGAFTGLAAQSGATPVWDRQSATCSDVYCHGGGTGALASDGAPGLLRTPVWTAAAADQAACGTCHGAPPIDSAHTIDMTLADCHTCHTRTVNASGAILLHGPPGSELSEHIDGTLDF